MTWFLIRKEALSWENEFHKKFRLKHSPDRGEEWFSLTSEEVNDFVNGLLSPNRNRVEERIDQLLKWVLSRVSVWVISGPKFLLCKRLHS